MKLLLVEDDSDVIRGFRDAFRERMPEAHLDVAKSLPDYLSVEGTPYAAYILDGEIECGNAFYDVAPRILERFPGAVLLHNSRVTNPKDADDAEAYMKGRFARGPDGKILFCEKNPKIAIEFLRTMAVDKDKSMKPPAQPPIPAPERRKI